MSLLYNLLNEFLFVFGTEDYFVCKRVVITEFDQTNFTIKATGSVLFSLLSANLFMRVCHANRHGEPFRIGKHPQGTEVKAITYSNMQIHTDKPTFDVYVIIDI
jgi:SHS2 domain-containing protein